MKSSRQPSIPTAPKHLGAEGRKLWRRILGDFQVDPGALPILEAACSAADRWAEARDVVAKEGSVVEDRWHQKKIHPAALVERDSRAAMVRHLRDLGLDLEPVGSVGRPLASSKPLKLRGAN